MLNLEWQTRMGEKKFGEKKFENLVPQKKKKKNLVELKAKITLGTVLEGNLPKSGSNSWAV